MFNFYPYTDSPLIGVPQHHKPFVHGLTVGPTPKPLLLFNIILFNR